MVTLKKRKNSRSILCFSRLTNTILQRSDFRRDMQKCQVSIEFESPNFSRIKMVTFTVPSEPGGQEWQVHKN